MNITELLRKRILITEATAFSGSKVTEVKVLEISPSGTWAKLMNMHGNKYWKPVSELALVEVLVDLKAGKPPESK